MRNYLKKLLNLLSLKKPVILGSFLDTPLYCDIDLYDDVSKININDENFKIHLLKIKQNMDSLQLKLSEIKYQYKDNKKKFNKFQISKINNNLEFVKLDFISFFFEYPMEITILYDFSGEKEKAEYNALLDDMKEHNDNVFKMIRRADSIARSIYNKNNLFNDILNNINFLYPYWVHCTLNRLKDIKLKGFITKKEFDEYADTLKFEVKKIYPNLKTITINNLLQNLNKDLINYINSVLNKK